MDAPPKQWMFLVCRPRYLPEILQELEDWACPEENQGKTMGRVLKYGVSLKGPEGVILFEWDGLIPKDFKEKWLSDQDVYALMIYEQEQGSEHTAPQEE
jgi:hypothetical protein